MGEHVKLGRDLKIGDRVKLEDPAGVGKITAIYPSKIFKAPGGAYHCDIAILAGPHKGKRITGQLFRGDSELILDKLT